MKTTTEKKNMIRDFINSDENAHTVCAGYTGEFIENSFVQISQFSFLVIVLTYIGFDFHLLED
jgi:hypothetical protein